MRYLILLLSALFLSGCIAYSDHPLTDPAQASVDPLIPGSWYWKQEGETGYLHIGKGEDPGQLHILMIGLDTDGDIELSEFSAHTSVLKKNKYLNVRALDQDEDAPEGYMLVKYQATNDQLRFAIMDAGVVRDAIESGALKGIVKKNGWASSVEIGADPARLQAYLLEQDQALFPETVNLSRVTLPEHRPSTKP